MIQPRTVSRFLNKELVPNTLSGGSERSELALLRLGFKIVNETELFFEVEYPESWRTYEDGDNWVVIKDGNGSHRLDIFYRLDSEDCFLSVLPRYYVTYKHGVNREVEAVLVMDRKDNTEIKSVPVDANTGVYGRLEILARLKMELLRAYPQYENPFMYWTSGHVVKA